MSKQELMDVVMPLTSAAETAAALAAKLRLDEGGVEADPAVAEALARTAALTAPPEALQDLDATSRDVVIGTVTSFLKQALELIENPARAGGWVYTDPVVLQSQGKSSARVADLIARVAPALPGLEEALVRQGARILDIGSGVAALTIAFCRTFPFASAVGLEPWEPAMELGRANVAAAGLEDRITLRAERVENIADEAVFDLAWMPALFLSQAVLNAAAPRVAASLRPGGWLILGRYAALTDPLAEALAELRTVRGGGSVLTDEEAIELLDRAGLTNVHALPGDWPLPVRFVAGRRSP
jgi:precorrin-6B methylase 2